MVQNSKIEKLQIKRNWKPEIAGILDIIGGLVFVITAYYINDGSMDDIFFVIYFVLALLAVAGGIFSFSRTSWALAIVGTVSLWLGLAGVVAFLIIYLVGSVFMGIMFLGGPHLDPSILTTVGLAALFLMGLGISSLILTIACKNEFK